MLPVKNTIIMSSFAVMVCSVLLSYGAVFNQEHERQLVLSDSQEQAKEGLDKTDFLQEIGAPVDSVIHFFPHKNFAILDILIAHGLGYKNYHAMGLDEHFSYSNLLKAIGITLAEGAVVIPLINLMPEWEDAVKIEIKYAFAVERERVAMLADLACSIAVGLAFHMQYDKAFHGDGHRASYPGVLKIVAGNVVEGIAFYAVLSLGAWGVDMALDQVVSYGQTKTIDDALWYFLPNKESLILDLVVCHALGHKNYDAFGLDHRPSGVNLLKALGITLLEGSLVIPILNLAAELEETLQKKALSFLEIKRDHIISFIDIAADMAIGLAFHMRYDNTFGNHANGAAPSMSYPGLLVIIAKNSIEGVALYLGFYGMGLGLDRGLDFVA